MDKLVVIKIGGNVVDDETVLTPFLRDFANLSGRKILVHGGGKVATQLAMKLGIEQQMVAGRRITDAETLRVVTMVYAGLINKTLVARLQAATCNAIGLSGADGDAIRAHRRVKGKVDYGFAGDVDAVNVSLLTTLLNENFSPVLAPITHDGAGQLLNTNADTIAQEVAKALSANFEVDLIYLFEKSGVLLDAEDDASVIATITPPTYAELKRKELVFAGMIPKLDNAFAAIQQGVKKVRIGKAQNLKGVVEGVAGTTFQHD